MGPRLKTSLRKRHPPAPPNKWDQAVTSHDDSGQVYTEVTCAGTSMTTDWKWKTRGSMQEHGCFISRGPGCSSLHDMATRSCLFNSSDITAEVLEEVPEKVGAALWNRLVAAQLDSVHLFLAFSQTYPSLITPRYHAIPKPNMPLPSYLKSLTSNNYQWLTQLTLLDITIPRTALIQLSLVPNLSVLTIGPGVLATDIGVDDSLLRTWSRSVTTGAFGMLRALVLRSQPHVTARAFSYLAAFPVLSIFAIESVASIGPRDKPTALTYGWKYKTDRDLRDWLVTGGGAKGSEWDVISQAFFELGSDFSEEQSTAAGIGAADALPTIHLAVGGLPENALVDVFAREGAMRVWYRSGKMAASDTSNDVQLPLPNWSSSSSRDAKPEPQGTAAALSQNQTVPQKRPLDLQRSSDMTRKKTKPVMRASKRQNLDDLLLLGFGT